MTRRTVRTQTSWFPFLLLGVCLGAAGLGALGQNRDPSVASASAVHDSHRPTLAERQAMHDRLCSCGASCDLDQCCCMPNASGEHGAEDQEPVDVDLSVATAVDNPAEQSPKLFGYQGLRLCLRIGPVPFSSAPVRYAGPDAPGKSCPVLEHAATPEPMLAERLIVWKILASRLQCVFRLERPPRLWVSA